MSQNLINSLDRKYKSFINEKSDWSFYLGIADYIKYIKETPKIYQVIENKILSEYSKEQEKLQKIRDKADDEILKAKDKLFRIIENKKLSYESLKKTIEVYQQYENNDRNSNLTQTENLNSALEDIVRNLYENGYKKIVKDFVSEKQDYPDLMEAFIFSPSMNEYYKESKKFEAKKSTTYWGHWINLELIYLAVYKKDELLEELRKDKKRIMDLWGFSLVVDEMNKIREQHEEPYKIKANFEPVIYERSRYTGYITRTHNFIIDELEKIEELNLEIKKKLNSLPKEKPAEESKIRYSFNKNGNKCYVKIGQFDEMEFEKNPALIINFFCNSSKYKNDYKSYHDFNGYYKFEKDIGSSDFARRIKEINERVKENTKNLINEIILQKPKNDNKNNELNQ
ncbi:TPA: hypothetical protein DCL28_01835 [Candidatus Komeilibacteria bacterium]|nr:hypothetical protein [Candidatus Komeilibacteria bacterium]